MISGSRTFPAGSYCASHLTNADIQCVLSQPESQIGSDEVTHWRMKFGAVRHYGVRAETQRPSGCDPHLAHGLNARCRRSPAS
ncbi:protein of unknown function [Cupriavidus taiwanensis]|uniref:Uncharacterized protein n=1 Tax=Cupriavidus taiwanensis TaxID=164546 RepID=A0A375I9F5_9BURK|nr:hypothetical protein CBM2608_A220031 [Cupriavidus taiwanensis]SPA27555.1 hypothetical protein CBM2623_A230030 [Cupriavidus taiwanensis]SPK71436.1 protein of unknown function [Cupriavidus taiwanensis]